MNWKKLQKLSDDFILMDDGNGNQLIKSERFNFSVKIKKDGYIPRSGLLLIDCLNEFTVNGAILDIGTGETGILAHYMRARGADKVVACDKDALAIKYIQDVSEDKNISWIISDVFLNIKRYKFGCIVSNPPQMPMLVKNNLHDYGGHDGRDIILKIIKNAAHYLRLNGRLFMLCFDFLGLTERFNPKPSISEIALNHNLTCKVIKKYQRRIRIGGKTEKNLPWIKKIYPKYKFKKFLSGDFYHNIFILEFRHQ